MIRGKPPLARSFGFRLAFLLAMALLPLGVLSAIQGQALTRELRARSEAAILGRTRAAAAGEQRALEQAMGAARTLAAVARSLIDASDAAATADAVATAPATGGDPILGVEECNAVARAIVRESDMFSFAGVHDREGRMLCSSQPQPPGWSFPQEMAESLDSDTAMVGVLEDARFTGRPVLYAQFPILDADGGAVAQAAVSVPHDIARRLDAAGDGAQGLELVTFEADGTLLTGPGARAAHLSLLPADRALPALAGPRALAFTAPAANGVQRIYAVVPLVPGQVFAMGSLPADRVDRAGITARIPPVVLPGLMWLVSLGVALLAAERLVTRHVRRLTAAIARFARGERVVPALDMLDAPWEIAALADAFARMAATIAHEEAEREESLRQKEVLLREVHHRVKNNLQLITSIMNLQIRRAHSAEARTLLRRVQERVMSLATVHRNLYQASNLASLKAGQLLEDILRQVMHMSADRERRFEVRKDIDPVVLSPDQAVPLALWFTEVLTNAMKYAEGTDPDGPADLEVSLKVGDDGLCHLVVLNSVRAAPRTVSPDGSPDHSPGDFAGGDQDGSGLGSKLLHAFAEQLGGDFIMADEGGWHRAELRFDVIGSGTEGDQTQDEATGGGDMQVTASS